jgi:TonB family protein
MTGQAELRLARTATPLPQDDRADGSVAVVVIDTALASGAEQSVIVELTYNAAGEVIDSRVLQGPEAYRQRALQVALGRRFETPLARLQVVVRFQGPVERIGTPPPPPAPPPPPGVQAPIRVGGQVMANQRLYSVPPEYPALARRSRTEGTVTLEATIDTQGGIAGLRVLSGPEILREAASDAVWQWRYEPFFLNGTPVPVTSTVVVSFSLQ